MRFREVIRPTFWLLAFIYFLFLSLVVSIWAALGNQPALISLIFLSATLLLLAWRMRMIIEIDGPELRINRAHIDLKYIKDGLLLNSEEMRKIRTRDADPAAFLAIRFWISTGVKITLNDKRDATPYWLISSKRGKELLQALKS